MHVTSEGAHIHGGRGTQEPPVPLPSPFSSRINVSKDGGKSMDCYRHLREVEVIMRDGVKNYQLLTASNGCVNGCCAGISIFSNTEYAMANTHEDQEGFFVISGDGWAKVGETEFPIEPMTSFIVPAGVSHTVKRNAESTPVTLFWFHAAV